VSFVLYVAGWFRAILPKSALRVEEEAWNAYPYTKTRYRCPFVEKFLLEIETRYLSDCCEEDNVFNMSKGEMSQRIVGEMMSSSFLFLSIKIIIMVVVILFIIIVILLMVIIIVIIVVILFIIHPPHHRPPPSFLSSSLLSSSL
jgi:CBS domain containing-hemolysin-like protein